MSETANAKDEIITLKLTEWEFDVVCKAIRQCSFPGTHIDLANKLIEKLKTSEKELEKK